MFAKSRKLLLLVLTLLLVAGIALALQYRHTQQQAAQKLLLARLAEAEKRLQSFLAERHPSPNDQLLILPLPVELHPYAQDLRTSGTPLQSLLAAVALNDLPAADSLLTQLRSQQPPLSPEESFTLCSLESERFLRDNQPEKAIPALQAALKLRPNDLPTRYTLALLLASPSASQSQLLSALDLLQSTLPLARNGSIPSAALQKSIGILALRLTTGDLPAHRRLAIESLNAALKVYTRDGFPLEWASTRAALGSAYELSTEGSPRTNTTIALLCYKDALTVFSPTNFPLDWAALQNKLAIIFADLPTGSPEQNFRLALAAFNAASTVYTQQAHPLQWARIQHNIGTAYIKNLGETRLENLAAAIAAFESSLAVYSRADHSYNYALAHSNLAAAYLVLANENTSDKRSHLRSTIAHARSALLVFTFTDYPDDYARTQNVLTKALTTYAEAEGQNADAIEPFP